MRRETGPAAQHEGAVEGSVSLGAEGSAVEGSPKLNPKPLVVAGFHGF